MDRARGCIEAADVLRRRLALRNVDFVQCDFRAFHPVAPFDVVLSVASAHYLIEEGRGDELFDSFREWLVPDGLLLLLAPRCRGDVPCWPALPPPFTLRDVVARGTLPALCRTADLRVERMVPVVGLVGTVAKQLSRAASGSRLLAAATYPLQYAGATLDRLAPYTAGGTCSSHWLLLARRGAAAGPVGAAV